MYIVNEFYDIPFYSRCVVMFNFEVLESLRDAFIRLHSDLGNISDVSLGHLLDVAERFLNETRIQIFQKERNSCRMAA